VGCNPPYNPCRSTKLYGDEPVKISWRAWIIIIALAMTSCNAITSRQLPSYPNRNPWVTKWLLAPTCQPPCWEHIAPGTTSTADALTLLGQIPGLKIKNYHGSSIEWILDSTDTGWIDDNKGLVSSITLDVNLGESFFLGNVNDVYGLPAQVRLYRCLEGFCEVHLTYPNHNMVIGLLLHNQGNIASQVDIETYSPIGRIQLYQSLDIFHNSFPDIEGTFQIWKGYGQYP
jgi:hypothetical protein